MHMWPDLTSVLSGKMATGGKMAGGGDKMAVDSGLVVVGLITLTYIILVFGLFFYVKNEWCELLFKNNTVRGTIRDMYDMYN
jgi:hypothetical protein